MRHILSADQPLQPDLEMEIVTNNTPTSTCSTSYCNLSFMYGGQGLTRVLSASQGQREDLVSLSREGQARSKQTHIQRHSHNGCRMTDSQRGEGGNDVWVRQKKDKKVKAPSISNI